MTQLASVVFLLDRRQAPDYVLAHDTRNTLAAAKEPHVRGRRPNMDIKIPGTSEGLPAIEEAIFAGLPVLWASTGTKAPSASHLRDVKALAAPLTVNTMPEGTLNALAEHGEVEAILPAHGGDCEEVLTPFAKAGIDINALAAQLQQEEAKSFVKSWNEPMACIASNSEVLK